MSKIFLCSFASEDLKRSKFRFLEQSKEMNIYEREYSFTSCKLSLIDNFNKINNDNFYKKIIDEQVKWSKELYQPFDEKYFIDLIK